MASRVKSLLSEVRFWKIFLGLIYTVGLVGLWYAPTRSLTASLTPYNIVLCYVLVLAFEPKKNLRFILLSCILAITGFLTEYLGVHYINIFGRYEYGENLGPKLSGVPLLIGFNWFMLTYITQNMYHRLPFWASVLAGACTMVIYDLLLEPFAMRFGLWSWAGGSVPFRNYLSWFLVSLLLQLILRKFLEKRGNPLSTYVFSIQCCLFFLTFWNE